MSELTELSATKHGSLRVVPIRVMEVMATRHLMSINVNEVAQAVSCFAVLITKVEGSNSWALSAVTGLELANNLFVRGAQWSAIYQPTSMQTYPFHLMKSDQHEGGFTVGIDEQSPVFSESEGEALFESSNTASLYLSGISRSLETNINNNIQTFEFTKKLNALALIKNITVSVEYQDGTVNTVKGLSTIDEDALQALSKDDFDDLRTMGYLAPIYSMMVSVYQLNGLLQRHNAFREGPAVTNIKLEVAK